MTTTSTAGAECFRRPRGPAREAIRLELGHNLAAERNRQLDDGCGDIDNVRRLVRQQRQRVRQRGA